MVSSEGILGDGDVGEGAASERAQVEGGLSQQETDLDTFLKFHIFWIILKVETGFFFNRDERIIFDYLKFHGRTFVCFMPQIIKTKFGL